MRISLNPEPAVAFTGECMNNNKSKLFSFLFYVSLASALLRLLLEQKREKEEGNESGRAHAEAICDVIFDNHNHNLPWAIKF